MYGACSGLKMFHKKLNKATGEYWSSTAVLTSLGSVVYERHLEKEKKLFQQMEKVDQ